MVLLTLAFAGAYLLIRRILKPIRWLTEGVEQVRIPGAIEFKGKEIEGDGLYLLSKSEDGHWRFINFDVTFWV